MEAEHALLVLADWPIAAVRGATAELPERAMGVIRDSGPEGDRHWAIDASSHLS